MNLREHASMVAMKHALDCLNEHKYTIAAKHGGSWPDDVNTTLHKLNEAMAMYKAEIRENINDTVVLSETNYRYPVPHINAVGKLD
jgi:hypothetical protein